MKFKLTIAIVVAVLLIGGGIWETVYVNNTFDEFEIKLEELMQQEEYNLDDIKTVGNWWYSRADKLEITIPHVQLTEITVTYGELEGAVENEDYDSASALLNRIYQYTIRIGNLYGFKMQNII